MIEKVQYTMKDDEKIKEFDSSYMFEFSVWELPLSADDVVAGLLFIPVDPVDHVPHLPARHLQQGRLRQQPWVRISHVGAIRSKADIRSGNRKNKIENSYMNLHKHLVQINLHAYEVINMPRRLVTIAAWLAKKEGTAIGTAYCLVSLSYAFLLQRS